MRGAAGSDDPRPAGSVLRTVAVRGRDVVTTVRDTAAEAMRSRRDPALVAERRRVAARRRLAAWSLAGLVLLALGTVSALDVARGGAGVATIGGLVLAVGLWVYCVAGSVSAARDLRTRTVVARSLPPAQPARAVVTGAARPLMARLDAYSDALRSGIGTIGVVGAAGAPRGARGARGARGSGAAGRAGATPSALQAVRDETLAAADAAEVRLRQQASQWSAMLRAAGQDPGGHLASACAELRREVAAGVDEYGRLVLAAAEASAASRQVAAASGAADDVPQATERLTALAVGMRELIDRGRATR